ncbi:hypothetical protein Tco_0905590 [Tanacetum coccineum]
MSLLTPSDIQHSAATQVWGCYRLVSEPGYRELVVMSSASSAVTYPSVYTDSEPSRVFWGADEKISNGGIPRVIVLRYDGLPMQLVAPSSPDYIPGPEDPQTPPVPQEEDEREPMFIQAQDPDYMPEPIYPKYIPLEDEHELPAEEQPLPHVDSPTAESLGYVTESNPEEDPEEYEDDETEDGSVDYPMDGGDDGDDDDGDSSRYDADDKDEDKDEEGEEEHLALADSTVVVPTDEPVSPSEETEPTVPPPSTDITIGARITVRPQVSISLPSLSSHPARDLAEAVPEIAPMTVGEVNTRVTELAELHEHDTQDLYALLEDAQDRFSQVTHQELQTHRDHVYAHETYLQAHQTQLQLQGTLIQTQHQMVETLRVIRDMRREMSDMHAKLLSLREQQMRARQPRPVARIPDHQDASGDADSHI